MAVYKDSSEKTYKLSSPINKGGEGEIFNIIGMDGYVAKIFHEKQRTMTRCDKLAVMIKARPDDKIINQYTWPISLLFDNNKFVGYIMPRLQNSTKLNEIYTFETREGLPWTLYVAIAKNLSAAINGVHSIGHVCGDLNPNNICVNPNNGIVTLVDTDSYHIHDTASGQIHRCLVGMGEYVPNELQGVEFSTASLPTFTKETDLFALAVLIFSLLMNGCHPFACTISKNMSSSTSFQPLSNIMRGLFPFMQPQTGIDIPKYAPPITILPDTIKDLFRRAFIDGHKRPQSRPDSGEWYFALSELENNIAICNLNNSHLYYNGLKLCPWCEVNSGLKNILTQQKAAPLVTGQVNYKTAAPLDITSVQLYEGNEAGTPITSQRYATVFPVGTTRYVFFTLKLRSTLTYGINTAINYTISDSAGNQVVSDFKPISLNPSYDFCWTGYGFKEPGNWEIGDYKLKVSIGNGNILETNFSIVEDDSELLNKPSTTLISAKTTKPDLVLWVWSVILLYPVGLLAAIPMFFLYLHRHEADAEKGKKNKKIALICCIGLTALLVIPKLYIIVANYLIKS